MFCGCLTNRVLNSAHELFFCAVSLKGTLASQTSGLIEESIKGTEMTHPCHSLTKDKTPIMTCTGTDRIVLVLTGLAQVRSGKFN